MINNLLIESNLFLLPNNARAISQFFAPGVEAKGEDGERIILSSIRTLLGLSEKLVYEYLSNIELGFSLRYKDFRSVLLKRAEEAKKFLPLDVPLSSLSYPRQLLLGAYFSNEYTFESTSLCNPSIVLNPIQSSLGAIDFILSVRGIGEGHVSSIGFREGSIDQENRIKIKATEKYPSLGELEVDSLHNEQYQISFALDTDLSERIIFPSLSLERAGMEDARFVRFVEDSGESRYLAPYTAFDGRGISQRILETKDFLLFSSFGITGIASFSKGLAIFPRKIRGKYVALARVFRENNSIIYTDDLSTWDIVINMQSPVQDWEGIQLGNCGSPIETDQGWLVITHGVGAMRAYSLGAILLDLDYPENIIATLDVPLKSASIEHRDGYVPNVVYSCGALRVGDTLLLPYALADYKISFATLSISDLIASMRKS